MGFTVCCLEPRLGLTYGGAEIESGNRVAETLKAARLLKKIWDKSLWPKCCAGPPPWRTEIFWIKEKTWYARTPADPPQADHRNTGTLPDARCRRAPAALAIAGS